MMNKIEIVKPFYSLNEGDILTLTEDKKTYTHENSQEFHNDDLNSYVKSTHSFKIPASCVDELIKEGIVREYVEKKHVNVFDAIDTLLDTYTKELKDIEELVKTTPLTMVVEKYTVLLNLIKVLTYLKSLKK